MAFKSGRRAMLGKPPRSRRKIGENGSEPTLRNDQHIARHHVYIG